MQLYVTVDKDRRTEAAEQTYVVALHADAGRDQQTPGNSLGVESDTLSQRHFVLFICRLARVLGDQLGRLCVAKLEAVAEMRL